jgi:hypothetical protein
MKNIFMYLFAYSLFNDAYSISVCIVSNERVIVSNELEMVWKGEIVP